MSVGSVMCDSSMTTYFDSKKFLPEPSSPVFRYQNQISEAILRYFDKDTNHAITLLTATFPVVLQVLEE